ncbi:DUF1425 domain-containing protein [Hydrocarboniclastica marina]|uniref:DUF1425 domain-containing protein n=1 Tax=Hydrocarboniclastica marina TaxID=2259620 RepID=A0A4P7XKB0_9ALTE|nr:YcfL family protein [Hydrocarboniclastica marina]MAM00382.1 hypothetical protein [Alteromonadaceae bacterium]QCF27646.1 DUF1425 domain-containing protein [Hydrocarboniclastica marina]|tara:strand:- start:150 stop:530 length:381 start_codon:yes stop_codon:yes gene_type:complete
MTIKDRVRLSTVAGLVLVLAACATSTPKRINIGPELNGVINIEEVVTERTEGGLYQVNVRIRNLLDQPVRMTYQFDWQDEKGRLMPSLLSGPVRVTADRRREVTVQGTAPSPEIVDFRLYLDERPE